MLDGRGSRAAIVGEAERLLEDSPETNETRNVRADEQDETTLDSPGLFIWILTFSAGVSGLLFGYDTGVISSTLVSVGTDLSNRPLTTLDKSLITSATSFIALLASPLAGILADVLGRKRVILLADVLFIVGAIWQALSNNVIHMIIGRGIVGAAVGIASFVTPVYISELSPSAFRGRLVTVQSLLITGGQVVAYIIGWAYSSMDHGWRVMVGIGAAPALAQVISMTFLPETPRWLVKAGHNQQALAVLARAYGGSLGSGVLQHRGERFAEQVLRNIETEASAEHENRSLRATQGSSRTGCSVSLDNAMHVLNELLLKGSNRRALIIACMLQTSQQLCGFNSLMYFSATIFALVGFQSPTLTALSVAITNFAFTLVAFYSIDRIGRRRILIYSVPVMVLGLSLCAFAFRFVDLSVRDSSGPDSQHTISGFWPRLILLSMVIYVAAYATGLGNVPWQQSELFPLAVRSLGSSLATGTNWLSNTVVGLTFLPMMQFLSPTGTFALYAIVCALSWITIFVIYPETAGLELEGVSDLLKDGWGVRRSVELFRTRQQHRKMAQQRLGRSQS